VIFKPSHRCIERELESSAKTKASTPLYYSSFAVAPHHSPLWYNLHLYVLFAKGEKIVRKGLIFHSYIRFWRFMPKGESIKPKAKGPHHHHQILKLMIFMIFKIGISLCSKGGESSTLKNWYLKTLLNTKRKFLLRGSFV
jgi:hypothetical protein